MIAQKKKKIKKKLAPSPLYVPKNGPMEIIVFASGGGGNLKAAIDLSLKKPNLIKVGLIVTDRLKIQAIDIAKQYNIRVIAEDFEKKCGKWIESKNDSIKAELYRKRSLDWHNNILKQIIKLERQRKSPFDFVVLSYHRWIHGDMLTYFSERMINQHAGDLTEMSRNSFERKYRGINPVLMALGDGKNRTRTSTFLVRENHDGGEILCQGPWTVYYGTLPITKDSALRHALTQKKQSDWPSLTA